jgi:hypothetical protein|tara:strand:+ start:174 stop:359 length:186 start_codon:yes stop_codon:yes gene_type:complete
MRHPSIVFSSLLGTPVSIMFDREGGIEEKRKVKRREMGKAKRNSLVCCQKGYGTNFTGNKW